MSEDLDLIDNIILDAGDIEPGELAFLKMFGELTRAMLSIALTMDDIADMASRQDETVH